jgi:NAD(P)-dependent dehydrogenase (short-subunit alcohol dehydrogenase family)
LKEKIALVTGGSSGIGLATAKRFVNERAYVFITGRRNAELAAHSSLMNEKGVNPKLIADQQGHGVDVNLNVYTQSSVESRIEALQTLESALSTDFFLNGVDLG